MNKRKLFLGIFLIALAFLPLTNQGDNFVYARSEKSLDYLKQYSTQPDNLVIPEITAESIFNDDNSREEFLLKLFDLEVKEYKDKAEFTRIIHEELTKQRTQIFNYTYVVNEEDCSNNHLKTKEQIEELKEKLHKLDSPFTGCTVPYQWRIAVLKNKGILFYNTAETHFFFYSLDVRPLQEKKPIGQSQNYIFMIPDNAESKGFYVFRKIDIVHNLIHNLYKNREIPYYFYPLPEIGDIQTITASLEAEKVSQQAKKQDDDPEIAKMKQEFKDNLRLLTTREKSIDVFAHKSGEHDVKDAVAERIPIQEFEQFLVMTVLVANLSKAGNVDATSDNAVIAQYHDLVEEIKKLQKEYYSQVDKIVSDENFQASIAPHSRKNDGSKLTDKEFTTLLNTTIERFGNNKEATALYEQFTEKIAKLLTGLYEKIQTIDRKLYFEESGPIDFNNPFRTVTDEYKALGVTWITIGHDPEAVIPEDSSFIEACSSIGQATKQQFANRELDKSLSTHPEYVRTASKDWMWQLAIPISIGIVAPFALKPKLFKPFVSGSFLSSQFRYTPYDMMARLSNLYFKVFNTQLIAAAMELANNLITPGSKESLQVLKATIDKQFAKKGGASATQAFSELEGIANNLEKEVDPLQRSYMTRIIDALKKFLKATMGKQTDEALAEAQIKLVQQTVQATREYQGAIQAGVQKGLEYIIPIIRKDLTIIKNNGALEKHIERALDGIQSEEAQSVFKAINWGALRRQLIKLGKKNAADPEVVENIISLLKEYPQVFMSNWGLAKWFKQTMKSFATELMAGEEPSLKGTILAGRKLPRMFFNRIFSFFYKIQAENYVREVSADEIRKGILIEFFEIVGTILPTELMLRSYYVDEANPQDQHKAMFSTYDFPYTKSHTAWIHRDMNERFWRNLYFGILAKAFRFHMLEARVSVLSSKILEIVKNQFGEDTAMKFNREILTKALNNHIVDIEAREGRAIFSFLWGDGTRFWRGFREFGKNMLFANIKNTLLRLQSGFLVNYWLQMSKRGEFSWISYLGNQVVGILFIDPAWGFFKSVPRAAPKFAQQGIIYDFSYAMTAGLSTSILSNVIQVNFITDYIDYERKNGSNKALGKMFGDMGSRMYHAPGNVAGYTIDKTEEFISQIIHAISGGEEESGHKE